MPNGEPPRTALAASSVPLSETKRALLGLIANGGGAVSFDRIPPAPDDRPIPLSFAQERVWFTEQLLTGEPLFNLVGGVMLNDPVAPDLVRRRLADAVAAHDALRSYVRLVEDEPTLGVADSAEPVVTVIDCSAERADPARAAARAAMRVAGQPYDLGRPPLWRVALVRLPGGGMALVIAGHHLVTDAISLTLLVHALCGHPQPGPPVRYADYAAWQRSPAWQEATAGDLDYWRDRLADLPPPLWLPTDRPRPPTRSLRGAALTVDLAPALVARLREVAREESATLYSVFLAGFTALLRRVTGAADIPVLCPVNGRNRSELRAMLGMFANMVVVRARLTGDLPFREVITVAQRTLSDAVSHQSVPFDMVVSSLGGTGRGPYPPLAQVGFNMPAQEASVGLPLLDLPISPNRSEFDLTAHIVPAGGGLKLQFEYAVDLFAPATIRRLMDSYLMLLSSLAADPGQPIDEPPLTPPEQHALLAAGHGPAPSPDAGSDPGSWTSLVERFAEQAGASPGRTALVFGDRSMTYAELTARADVLAHRLRARGVGPESRVAVCLRRGFDMVAALLASWRAGAAYVPVDPDQPAPRTRLILEETAPAAILTSTDLLAGEISDALDAVPGARPRVVRVDTDGLAPPEPAATTAGPVAVRPDTAAYVMYTSGSTGRPKGVVISHAGIANRVAWSVREHALGAGDRVLQKTRLTFDAAGWEIFAPLVSGGATVLAPHEVDDDPPVMLRAVAEHRVTVLQLVPSVLRLLVDAGDWSGCGSLRLLCCAGEPLDAELCAQVLERLDLRIVNTYGPTECAIDVAAAGHDPEQRAGPAPIGRPIDNTRLHVLDPRGRPAPVGVRGELFASGVGLARGYLDQPGLTAASFLPDPYGPPGSRMYRTGDLARWRDDGSLEFLGRADQQVKINGVRVEPAEAEHALRQHPGVLAVAVTPRPTGRGGVGLVGYVVGDVPFDALRRFVRDRLPGPMAPARFVRLDALPLTPTGKLDRAALPPPDAGSEDEAEFTPPRDHAEQVVAAVWAEVLGLERIGAHDDFFALGGHSLLLTRVAARLRRLSGADVPLRRLFTAATVAEQGRLLAEGPADREPIPRADRSSPLPLSSGQQRLWFLDRLDSGSPQYVIPHVVRLRGELDLAALRRAVTGVVARHEVLRTRYQVRDGEPFQVVDPPGEMAVGFTDVSGAVEPQQAALGLVAEAISRPFDLAAGPVLRCEVVRTAAEDHLLLLAMHHIAFDGASMAVFGQELAAGYAAALAGGDRLAAAAGPAADRHGAEPPAIQYADFAAWQLASLDGDELREQLDYWTERLADLEPVELPTDRPREVLASPRGATCVFHIPEDLSGRVLRLGRAERATAFMTLLAAFDVLLARYTGVTDLAVGTPVGGRTRPELETLIGFVANTLVLRADLAGDPSFRTVLERVRSTCVEGFARQDLPFERLVDVLQPERDLSRNPLFQIMFEMAAEGGEIRLPGLAVGRPCDDLPWQTSKFDLTLGVVEQADGSFLGYVEYATALFDPSTVDRLISHYLRVLEQVADDPDLPLGRLDILTPAERRQLLRDWNRLDPPEPAGECLHEAIARTAAERPDALAVSQRDQRLSYRELERQANRLAHRLRAHGVSAETPVAVFLERSVPAVVALLGVLKAGGVYLPVDPNHPDDRVELLIRGSGAQVVLTHPGLVERLAPLGVEVLTVDEPDAEPGAGQDAPPPAVTSARNLAYVIHTSGSTGGPKGVMVDHAAYLSHCRVVIDRYAIRPGSRVVLLSALVFDVAMDQIGATLLAGGAVVVADPDLWAPGELPDRLAAERVEIMEITPAHYRELMSAAHPGDERLRGLRLMNVGSETVTYQDAQRWLAAGLPGTFMCNYGPTEATVTCTAITVDAERAAAGRPEQALPIGRPFRDTRAYVLDPWLNPVPIGMPGELHLGGVRLARGYLRRPDLTAERFVPDPFSGEPGARLYRTGDLVRYRQDGMIEFLGRLDSQVKIRGFRIELEEIEATLHGHPDVRAAATVVHRGQAGPEIAGYVVFASGASAGLHEVRDHLRSRLPDYMVPTRWAALDELPLTPSKKVDRRALSAIDSGSRLRREYAAPRTRGEELIAEVWAELLDVAEIGAHDDFFDLGGHSLLATRAHARLQQLFGAEFPLRVLFEAVTPAELAPVIEEAVAAELERLSDEEVLAQAGSETPVDPVVARRLLLQQRMRGLRPGAGLPALRRIDRSGPIPLSYGQQRLWFLDQLTPGSLEYVVPLVLRLRGRLDHAALTASLSGVIERHEILRTRYVVVEGEVTQVIDPPPELRLPPREVVASDLTGVLDAFAAQPFDLARGPVLRAELLRVGPEEHVLNLNLHHIACDEWSTDVIGREIVAGYEAYAAGRAPELSPPPAQYADFAVWQRQSLAAGVLERKLDHWRHRLTGLERLRLPLDRPRTAPRDLRGACVIYYASPELRVAVRELVSSQGCTLFTVLMAGFAVLLAKLTGQRDIAIGVPMAGRGRAEIENTVGFFVNTVVLRCDLSGDPSFAEILERVRLATLDAIEHQDVPFERVVNALEPERDLSRTALVDTLFNLQHASDVVPPRAGDLVVEEIGVDSPAVRADLMLGTRTLPDGSLEGGGFEYAAALFDEPTIHDMIERHLEILSRGSQDPAVRFSELPAATAEERAALARWNDTGAPVPDRTLHQLIADQVRRTPDAVAVTAEDGELTYAELSERADRMACELRARGVSRGGVVGVCLRREVELVVALLAVLRAGAAYLPLDPEHPPERLRHVVRDAGAVLAVTRRRLADRLGEVPLLLVDEMAGSGDETAGSGDEAAGSGHEAPPEEAGPADLAYVIYTSGSTGEPKGVMVSHRGIVNRLLWMQQQYGLTPRDRVLQKTTYTFDVSVWEFFWPLLAGARVVLAPPDAHLDPVALAGWMAGQRVTHAHFVPSMLDVFLEVNAELPDSCREVFCSGEALRAATVRRFQVSSAARLHNLYGPTEASVDATSFEVAPGQEDPVPIGAPIHNMRAHVLDLDLNPAPVGVTGEIYLGGVGLARGYLNRPGLTAERFVPDPFGGPGARLYRTGDLGRWRADGVVEHQGRVDDQFKIRGLRIEPGEIEAAMASHPGVSAAAVAACRSGQGDPYLVGYVVGEADSGELREHLSGRLPAYMVPTHFATVERLPLTSSGKLDRKALPDPRPTGRQATATGPLTPVESAIAAAWAEVLGDGVSASDNFFELGGDSMRAVRVVGALRARGIELSVADLFRHPTVAALAGVVRAPALRSDDRRCERFELVDARDRQRLPEGIEDAYPLAEVQAGMLFEMFADTQVLPYHNVTSYALGDQAPFSPAALREAAAVVAARHEALRTSFDLTAYREALQLVHRQARPAVVIDDLRGLPEPEQRAEITRAALAERREPFDLARPPLWRLRAHRVSDQAWWLSMVECHAILDGWSHNSLLTELVGAYRAIRDGSADEPVPTPDVRYADFIAAEREALRSEEHRAHWERQLVGREVRPLPERWGDRAAGARVSTEMVEVRDLEPGLRRVAAAAGVPLKSVFLAGYLLSLQAMLGGRRRSRA
ncbi:MAG: amino acid adenylation domain-containing protein [Micromonosporaceae bacterium]|nr:amino acid adenylation domain-containing protein [Micromonosporaceae bacterium]